MYIIFTNIAGGECSCTLYLLTSLGGGGVFMYIIFTNIAGGGGGSCTLYLLTSLGGCSCTLCLLILLLKMKQFFAKGRGPPRSVNGQRGC